MNEEFVIRKKPSRWWYLLPVFLGVMGGIIGGVLFTSLFVFLGIIGGIIGYFLFKDKDRKFAERLLIIGIAATIVGSIIQSLLIYIFISYVYSSIVLSKKTATALEVVDSYCSYGTVTITLRNIGTKTLPATQQTCIQIDGECSGKCVPLDLEPGKTAVLKISGCTLGKFHRWRIGGPTSSITVGAYC